MSLKRPSQTIVPDDDLVFEIDQVIPVRIPADTALMSALMRATLESMLK